MFKYFTYKKRTETSYKYIQRTVGIYLANIKNHASCSSGLDLFLVVCSARASNDTENSAVQNVPEFENKSISRVIKNDIFIQGRC